MTTQDPRWLDLTPFKVSDDQFARNEEIIRDGCDWNCQLCGKPLNTTRKTTGWVRLPNGDDAWPYDEELPAELLEDIEDDMGCYPVGPECVKKLPKAYYACYAGA